MMYGYFWRRLPGPVPVRIGICLALLALVVAVCFAWLFPWVAAQLPVNDPSVGAASTALLENPSEPSETMPR